MNPFLPKTDPQTWRIDPSNPSQDIVYLTLNNVLVIALDLAGIVATIYILIGAFNYFTAFGNEEKAETAKKTLTWAIIGLIVIILSAVIVNEIFKFLGVATPIIP